MISVTIGKYTFNECRNGSMWVTQPGGEAMEIDYIKFEETMDKFYKDNF